MSLAFFFGAAGINRACLKTLVRSSAFRRQRAETA
jgi:hypothetical protein